MSDLPPEYDPSDDRQDDGEGELLEEGLASVILVEPRDDVAAICGRVDTAPTFAVVVHAPRGNRQLSTELGIRRLARHAEDSGKVVAIATRSGSLKSRARMARLPVARKPEGIRWDSAGRRSLGAGRARIYLPALGGALQVLVLVLVAGAFLALAATVAPSARVEAVPPAETLTRTIQVTASPGRKDADFAKRELPARTVTETQRVTLAVPATGRVFVGTVSARVGVSITNPGAQAVTLPAGTVLLAAPDSQPFETDAETTVPAGGAIAVQATAARPGSKGNVPAGAITAWQEARFGALAVTNAAPAAGGADEERKAVDAADVIAIRAIANGLDKTDVLRSRVVAARPNDAVFVGTASTTVAAKEPSPAVGMPAEMLLMDVDVTVSALAVPADVVRRLAEAVLLEGQGAGELLPGTVRARETGARQINADDNTVRTSLEVSGQFARGVTHAAVREAVKGKGAESAKSTLAERYGIQEAKVRVTPSWAPWVPRFGFRISVTLRESAEEPRGSSAPATANAAVPTPTTAATAPANPRP